MVFYVLTNKYDIRVTLSKKKKEKLAKVVLGLPQGPKRSANMYINATESLRLNHHQVYHIIKNTTKAPTRCMGCDEDVFASFEVSNSPFLEGVELKGVPTRWQKRKCILGGEHKLILLFNVWQEWPPPLLLIPQRRVKDFTPNAVNRRVVDFCPFWEFWCHGPGVELPGGILQGID